jgi:hypothetical protein
MFEMAGVKGHPYVSDYNIGQGIHEMNARMGKDPNICTERQQRYGMLKMFLLLMALV